MGYASGWFISYWSAAQWISSTLVDFRGWIDVCVSLYLFFISFLAECCHRVQLCLVLLCEAGHPQHPTATLPLCQHLGHQAALGPAIAAACGVPGERWTAVRHCALEMVQVLSR